VPDVSGFELCSRLRHREPGRRWNRDVPVNSQRIDIPEVLDWINGFMS
jgi:hypothetical protein